MKQNSTSPIFQALTVIYDFLVVNLLCIVCSLPVITMGASVSATYYVMLKIIRKEDSSVVGMFFSSFRQNLKQGTGLTLIFAISGLLLFFDFQICKGMQGTVKDFAEAILTILVVIWSAMASYAFPLLGQFDNPVKVTLKNSAGLAVIHLKKTVVILLLNAILPVTFFCLPELFMMIVPVYASFGVAVTAFLNAKILVKVFDSYIEKPVIPET